MRGAQIAELLRCVDCVCKWAAQLIEPSIHFLILKVADRHILIRKIDDVCRAGEEVLNQMDSKSL